MSIGYVSHLLPIRGSSVTYKNSSISISYLRGKSFHQRLNWLLGQRGQRSKDFFKGTKTHGWKRRRKVSNSHTTLGQAYHHLTASTRMITFGCPISMTCNLLVGVSWIGAGFDLKARLALLRSFLTCFRIPSIDAPNVLSLTIHHLFYRVP